MISMGNVLRFLNSISYGKNGFVLLLLLYETLYAFPFKPRNFGKIKWYIALPFVYAAFICYGFFIPFIKFPIWQLTVIFNCILIFAVSVLASHLCFKRPFKRTIFDCSAAYISQNLTLNIQELICKLVRVSGWARLAIYFFVAAIAAVILFFAFVYKNRNNSIIVNTLQTMIVVIIASVASNVIFTLFNVMQGLTSLSQILLKCVSIIVCLLSLLYQFSVFRNAGLINKQYVTEQLLVAEQKQHKISEENIELINIKCHDLKKQIKILRQKGVDGDADEMLDEVEKAVAEYGERIETGNNSLDLVLSEKKIACDKNNVRLEVIADGASLLFMSPTDTYSFFMNALDNALESVVKVGEEYRTISLYVKKRGNIVSVRISNHLTERVTFRDELPQTTKADKDYHGFGVRSMRYVVEKYGGNMVFEVTDDTFTVNAIFPAKS